MTLYNTEHVPYYSDTRTCVQTMLYKRYDLMTGGSLMDSGKEGNSANYTFGHPIIYTGHSILINGSV